MEETHRFESETSSWYTQPGPHSDVIVSSRIRLARNLVEFPFPESMSEETEARVRDEIIAAFHRLPEPLTTVYLDQIPVTDRNLLLEKHFVTSEFAQGKNKALVLGVDERFTAMINEGDHLRLAVIRSGLALREAYAEVDRVDTALEEHLNFAASLEWGYLNAAFADIGTGMRASVMVHLPGLVAEATIEEALNAARELGFRVKGYPADGEKSLGDMYLVSNATSLGASEAEILERMEMMARELADAERKARLSLLQQQGVGGRGPHLPGAGHAALRPPGLDPGGHRAAHPGALGDQRGADPGARPGGGDGVAVPHPGLAHEEVAPLRE